MAVFLRLLLCACVLFPAPLALAQSDPEPIVATDLLKLRQLGDVAVSPDGRDVLYTVRSIVPSPEGGENYVYQTHLWLAPSDGRAAARPLTRGAQSATDPAWHPDGDRIAFVRRTDGKPQIFVLPLTGGEAYQVTRFPQGATAPRWSPEGDRLLFAATLSEQEVRTRAMPAPRWPSERPGRTAADTTGARPDPAGSLAEIRAWLDHNADDGNPRVLSRLDLQGERDLEPRPAYRHLFVVDAEGKDEPVAVTQGFHSFSGGEWLADGERIVFSGAPTSDLHPDRVRDSDLYVARADGQGYRRLLDLKGYAVFAPRPAPEGDAVAFLARALDDPGYAQTELGVHYLDVVRKPELLTLTFDRSVSDPRWSPDGWHLYFVAAADGGFPLYRVRAYDVPSLSLPADTTAAETTAADSLTAGFFAILPDSAAADTLAADTLAATATAAEAALEVEQLTGFDRGIRSYDVGTGRAFYVLTEVANPYELYASDFLFQAPRRLTNHNADWLKNKRLSFPTAHTLQRDSLEVDYWVMKPAVFDDSLTYPLLLEIHGGPSAMWGPGEASMWLEFQFFAARGYGIVYSNPRGSGGYGHAFKRANYQDWGTGPAGDVLAAASAAAEAPWVDPDRQVVTGGSYAGYLTAWIVAHDDRFKAAVAQRGVYDLAVFLGEGNAWRLVPNHFGGYPWDETATVPPSAIDTLLETAVADTSPARPTVAIVSLAEDSLAEDSLAADSLAVAPLATDSLSTDASVAASDTFLSTAMAAVGTAGSMAERPLQDVQEGASIPESIREILIRNSPLTYVDHIHTPLLIIHSDQDLRTGVIQSEMLYKSLKILDRPVEYVRYPGEGHELSRSGDPKRRMDRILRIYEFMERYIGPASREAAPLPSAVPPPSADAEEVEPLEGEE